MKKNSLLTLAVSACLFGCSSSSSVSQCTPGEVVACPCGGGPRGVQTCEPSGAFGACRCLDSGGIDAPAEQIDSAVSETSPVGPDVPFDVPLDRSADLPDAGDVPDSNLGDGASDAPDAAPADVARDVACEAGVVCGAACADLQRDPHNCGRCGNDCDALTGVVVGATRCVAGVCDVTSACLPSRAHCTASPADGCETDVTSPARCGACSNRCAEPTPYCSLLVDDSGGRRYACASDCGPATPARCLGRCVDTASAPDHCGRCGNACPARANATATCVAGACGSSCNVGFHDCGGACVPNGDLATCGSSCTPCPARAHASAACNGTTCGFTCDAGFADCNGDAADGCEVDLGGSNAHCGACRAACAAGTRCESGTCVGVCAAPTSYCAGACRDLSTDVNACSSCTNVCPRRANATSTCAGGVCGFRCDAGRADCNGSPADGCEADLTAPSSCGRCDRPCAEPTPFCRAAGATASCESGCGGSTPTRCAMTCVDTNTDASHCGSCDRRCDGISNGAATCAGGVCGVRCDSGYTRCGDRCVAAGTCCEPVVGVDPTIVDAFDGGVSVVGAETDLHTANWLRSYGGLFLRDGSLWFAEGTTDCGGWNARSTSFRPGGDGRPESVVTRCEGAPGAAVSVSLASSGNFMGLCEVTHASDYGLHCGRVGSAPGSYTNTASLGRPLIMALMGGPGGFAGVVTPTAQPYSRVWLQRFDRDMVPTTTATVATSATGNWYAVAGGVGAWWVLQNPSQSPWAPSLRRVRDDNTVEPEITLPLLGGGMGAQPTYSFAPSDNGLTFLAARSDAYWGSVTDAGSVSARRVYAGGVAGGVIVPYGTQRLLLLASTGQPIRLVRVDCSGRRLEPPVDIAASSRSVFGAALDATGQNLWIVTSRALGSEYFRFAVQRVRLP